MHTLWEGQSACSLLVGNVIRSNDFPESSRPQTNKQVKQQAAKQTNKNPTGKQKQHYHQLTKQTPKKAGLALRLREHYCNAPCWKKERNPASGKKGSQQWWLGGHEEQLCSAPTWEPCLAAAHLALFLQPKATLTSSTALTIASSHTTRT